MLTHQTVVLISHARKIVIKILHARLQHYVNQKIPGVQDGFGKERGTRDQIANIHWIIEKMEISEKYLSLFLSAKAFDYVDHDKLWKALRWEYETILPVY